MQVFRKGREELSQGLQEQIWKNEVALELRVSESPAGRQVFGSNMRDSTSTNW